jgi:hypothetical protein
MKREKLKVITPPEPTHQTEIEGGRLIITYRVRKHWFLIVWYLFGLLIISPFLFGLGYPTVMMILFSLGITSNGPSMDIGESLPFGPIIFFLIINILMLLPTIMMIFGLLWQLFGIEKIDINKERMILTRRVFWWSRSRMFHTEHIQDFRVSQYSMNMSSFRPFSHLLGSSGTISFDYGAKSFQFGNEMDEAEARQIIK